MLKLDAFSDLTVSPFGLELLSSSPIYSVTSFHTYRYTVLLWQDIDNFFAKAIGCQGKARRKPDFIEENNSNPKAETVIYFINMQDT